ncbi:MAG: hypothetical protein K2Y05_03190 [Hyphomicrobiaceae bacterium]|nr:hypothetical protein [Hyphomicrobiaceae bacterium]
MLGLIILIALQFALAFLGAPQIMKFLPVPGDLRIFAMAVVYGVIVWIVALVGAFALKDVNVPSGKTLGAVLIGALIGAGLTLVPGLMAASPVKFDKSYLPLIGAIVGYVVRRT